MMTRRDPICFSTLPWLTFAMTGALTISKTKIFTEIWNQDEKLNKNQQILLKVGWDSRSQKFQCLHFLQYVDGRNSTLRRRWNYYFYPLWAAPSRINSCFTNKLMIISLIKQKKKHYSTLTLHYCPKSITIIYPSLHTSDTHATDVILFAKTLNTHSVYLFIVYNSFILFLLSEPGLNMKKRNQSVFSI